MGVNDLVKRSYLEQEPYSGFCTPLDMPVAVSVRSVPEAQVFLRQAAGDIAQSLAGSDDTLFQGNYEFVSAYSGLYAEAMDDLISQVNKLDARAGIIGTIDRCCRRYILPHKTECMTKGLSILDTDLGRASEPIMGIVERLWYAPPRGLIGKKPYVKKPWLRHLLIDTFLDALSDEVQKREVLSGTGYGEELGKATRIPAKSAKLAMKAGTLFLLAALVGGRYFSTHALLEEKRVESVAEYGDTIGRKLDLDRSEAIRENLRREMNSTITELSDFNRDHGLPYFMIAGFVQCCNERSVQECLAENPPEIPEENIPRYERNYALFSRDLAGMASRVQAYVKELDNARAEQLSLLEEYAGYALQAHPSEYDILVNMGGDSLMKEEYEGNIEGEARLFTLAATALLAQSGDKALEESLHSLFASGAGSFIGNDEGASLVGGRPDRGGGES